MSHQKGTNAQPKSEYCDIWHSQVRCDGQRTGCASCQRLGFDCSFRENNANNDSPSPLRRPRRCRVRQACTACHELKIRCTGGIPRCRRCNDKGMSCLYPNSGSRRQVISGTETLQTSAIATAASGNGSHRQESLADNPPCSELQTQGELVERTQDHRPNISEEQL